MKKIISLLIVSALLTSCGGDYVDSEEYFERNQKCISEKKPEGSVLEVAYSSVTNSCIYYEATSTQFSFSLSIHDFGGRTLIDITDSESPVMLDNELELVMSYFKSGDKGMKKEICNSIDYDPEVHEIISNVHKEDAEKNGEVSSEEKEELNYHLYRFTYPKQYESLFSQFCVEK